MLCKNKIPAEQPQPEHVDDKKVNAFFSNTESKSTIMQVVKTKVKGEEINIMLIVGLIDLLLLVSVLRS